jgi:zinc/manganese transport system substrate-binding protein
MIFNKLSIIAACLVTVPAIAAEKIRIITSIPDLAWVAVNIGGDRVEAKPLLRGTENPHFVDAVPEFTRLVASADIVCIVGLDLEVGYMPPVLARSGNAQVQPGGKGYCEAGKSVSVLDKTSGPIDRSMGDVHPHGNPHFYLSPKSLAESAKAIADILKAVDPAFSGEYDKNLAAFALEMKALSNEISATLKPLHDLQSAAGKPLVMEYHREFTYFMSEYGIKSFGSVEEKPGVPPSAGRLGTIAAAAKAAGVRVVLAADYNPNGTLQRFAELSGVNTLIVPTMVQPAGSIKTYASLQRHIALSLAALTTQKAIQN